MKIFNKAVINGTSVSDLRSINLELKEKGFKGFRPSEMVSMIEWHKESLETDMFLDGINLDGAKVVETAFGKRFIFLYRKGEFWLKSITPSDSDVSEDGLFLTREQKREKREARRAILKGRPKIDHTPNTIVELFGEDREVA